MPHLDAPMSALEAMDLSIREGRTVHLRWSPSLGNDLFNESEGGDVSAAGDEIEYWGPDTDRDGVAIRPWRVRLHDWGCETWRVAAALALACGLEPGPLPSLSWTSEEYAHAIADRVHGQRLRELQAELVRLRREKHVIVAERDDLRCRVAAVIGLLQTLTRSLTKSVDEGG